MDENSVVGRCAGRKKTRSKPWTLGAGGGRALVGSAVHSIHTHVRWCSLLLFLWLQNTSYAITRQVLTVS